MSWKLGIPIFCAFLLLGDCWATSLPQDLARSEAGRSASELVRLCKSDQADRLAYCLGYIEGATHFWKYQTARASSAQSDQSFFAGVKGARESTQRFFEACKNCNVSDMESSFTQEQQFVERMRKLPGELKIHLGNCKAQGRHNENYCLGYDKEAESSVAQLAMMWPSAAPEDARYLGLGHGANEVNLHLFASAEFHSHQPCVRTTVDAQEAKNILLAFVRKYPEQQESTTAILLLTKALFYDLCPGLASQDARPHMEQCINWDRIDGRSGAKNICSEAVVIEFISKRPHEAELTVESRIIHGNSFDVSPGLSRMPSMFTVCPVGYASSVAVRVENREKITAGRYDCVRK